VRASAGPTVQLDWLQKVQEEKAGPERATIQCDRQSAALIQTMNAIAPLVGEEPLTRPASEETELAPGGMTESIRTILADAGEPLTASEIRGRLEQKGFDLKAYSNLLANTHTLRRGGQTETAEPGQLETAAVGNQVGERGGGWQRQRAHGRRSRYTLLAQPSFVRPIDFG